LSSAAKEGAASMRAAAAALNMAALRVNIGWFLTIGRLVDRRRSAPIAAREFVLEQACAILRSTRGSIGMFDRDQ
jgi:hypothetical protein